MWHDLTVALALLLVFEGIFPFINPGVLRRMLMALGELRDAQLRFAGLTSMLIGLALLFIVNR